MLGNLEKTTFKLWRHIVTFSKKKKRDYLKRGQCRQERLMKTHQQSHLLKMAKVDDQLRCI